MGDEKITSQSSTSSHQSRHPIDKVKMPSHKSFRTKQKLAKAQKQNRPIPQWIRLRTGNTIRLELPAHLSSCRVTSFPILQWRQIHPQCLERRGDLCYEFKIWEPWEDVKHNRTMDRGRGGTDQFEAALALALDGD